MAFEPNWKPERKPDADCYFLSFPKAGRTWLRALLGKALVDHFRLPPEDLLETEKLSAAAGLGVAAFYHDGSAMLDLLPWQSLVADKSAYRDKRVLLIGRDARDTLVSAYFQASRRLQIIRAPIRDFVRDDRFGARKMATFYRQWEEARSVPRAFEFVRYESMHTDPAGVLRRTLAFLGVSDVTDATLDAAVAFARFDNLRKVESEGRYAGPILQAGSGADPESFKVRRGKVGGFRDYLADEDVAWIDARVAESRCDFIAPAQ